MSEGIRFFLSGIFVGFMAGLAVGELAMPGPQPCWRDHATPEELMIRTLTGDTRNVTWSGRPPPRYRVRLEIE